MTRLALLASIDTEILRFAILDGMDGARPLLSQYHELRIRPGEEIVDLIAGHVATLPAPLPPLLGLEVSAPVGGDRLTLTHSGVTFSIEDLRQRCGFDRCVALNDAACTARSLSSLPAIDTVAMGRGGPPPFPLAAGRYGLVTVDMGLGVSAVSISPDGQQSTPTDTESGHLAFSPLDDLGDAILRELRRDYGRVSYERVLCWSALPRLHGIVADFHGRPAGSLTALEIAMLANSGSNADCQATFAAYFEILGAFTGDMAMALGVTQGMFLSGRVIREAQYLLGSEGFRRQFDAKGRMSNLVSDLPVWAITNAASGMVGLALALHDHMVAASPAPRPRASKTAAPSANLMAELLEASPDGLLILDSEMKVQAASDQYALLASLPSELLRKGCDFQACLANLEAIGQLQGAEVEQVRREFAGGRPFTFEHVAVGGRRLRQRAKPRAAGGWAISCRDISLFARRAEEMGALAAELRDDKAEAEAANRAKSAFLATMSHEIRTPLNGVLGMAQAMAAEQLSPRQRDRVDIIRQSGEALLAILNDVLDISKIEAGKLELETIAFDLGELLAGAHSAFTAIANKKGLSFALNIDPQASGWYQGDPTRIRQIVYNLISNALKFTSSGEVRVRAFSDPDRGLGIMVSDTGVGIAPDRLQHLFEKFIQEDNSTTRKFGGTGLGLSISHELTRLMGGEIEVESTPGAGAAFTVILPLGRVCGAPAAGEGDAPQCVSIPQGLRVLAAEDNPVNQLVLKTLLYQLGIEVTTVQNGAEALAAWELGQWDLILMDIQMPEMDGPTATRAIRQREQSDSRVRTPILALTANVMTHQAEEYAAAGMDGLVAKPLQVGALLESMAAALSQAEAASSVAA